MQDFMATYGLWLLIALAVIVVLFFLLRGKSADANGTTAAPPPQAMPVEPVAPPPPPAPVPAPAPATEAAVETPVAPQTSGTPDNLLQIKGIGPKVNAILIGLGITRFEQIAAWTDADIAKIDGHLGNFGGRAVRDQWIDQARYLAHGDLAGFEAKYGKL